MADVPTISWSETSPAGGDDLSAGDNKIRELKTQIREVIDVDHDFPSSGKAADVGQHKKVTLQEQANLGTGAVGTTILGSQTVDGKGELVYTDEGDTDVQITKDGSLYAVLLSGNQSITGDKTFAALKVSANTDIGDYNFRAKTLQSDVATGTAPFTVASATKVSTLDVDKVDGADASATPAADKIVIADAQGFLHTPSSAPDSNYEVANKKYVDDSIMPFSVYDSGWFAISADTSYSKTHNLGTTKVLITLMGATSSGGANAGLVVNDDNTINLVWHNLTTTAVYVRWSTDGVSLYAATTWATPTYARIVMLALE